MKYLSVLILLLFSILSFGQFSEKDKAIIYTKSMEVLSKYNEILNELSDKITDIELSKSLGEELNNLFINRKVLVYNDLDPNHQLSEFYEVETYTSNLILWYPDGMEIFLNLSNIKTSEIYDHDDDVFSLDLLVVKKINGNYLNKVFNKNIENLTFRIAFTKKSNSFENFRIVGIRNANSETKIDDSKAINEVSGTELPENEIVKIRKFIITILNDYVNYLNLLGDPNEIEEDKEYYEVSLKGIFNINNSLLYNDLIPDPEEKFINVEDYISNYRKLYPKGLKNLAMNIDSVEFGAISEKEKGSYSTHCYIDKYFSGNLKDKEFYRFASEMIFKINFDKSGNSYSNFEIESIDIGSMDYFADNEEELNKPEFIIKPVTRKGLYMGAEIPGGISIVQNQNLLNEDLINDYHAWNISYKNSIQANLQLGYYFNDHFSIESGLGYYFYSSNYNLKGDFNDNDYSIDSLNNIYYKRVEASYDSLINIYSLSIPICFNYINSKPGKLGFFIKMGLDLSYLIYANYKASGYYNYSGYFPDILPNLFPEGIWIDEGSGFKSRKSINSDGNLADISKIYILTQLSLGISIPIGYYNSIDIGPYGQLGLIDFDNSNKYYDIFGKEKEKLSTKLFNFGLQIRYIYYF